MSDTPKASYVVGVVHYGDPKMTIDLLRSLDNQVTAPSDVVLVDNQGLPRSTWEELGIDRPLTVVEPGDNLGYAGGVNRCLDWAASKGSRYLWILNPDVELDRRAGRSFLEAAAVLQDWDVMGSVVTRGETVWFGGGGYSALTGRAWHEAFGENVTDCVLDGSVHPTDWINGCSLFINMGGTASSRRMDEHFFLYREELEWQRRQPSMTAYLLATPLVDHAVGGSTGGASQGLGRVFMARNSWIIASQQRGARKLCHIGAWMFEFVVYSLLKRDVRGVREALRGFRLRCVPGLEVLERL